jgi:hypothetical protein
VVVVTQLSGSRYRARAVDGDDRCRRLRPLRGAAD